MHNIALLMAGLAYASQGRRTRTPSAHMQNSLFAQENAQVADTDVLPSLQSLTKVNHSSKRDSASGTPDLMKAFAELLVARGDSFAFVNPSPAGHLSAGAPRSKKRSPSVSALDGADTASLLAAVGPPLAALRDAAGATVATMESTLPKTVASAAASVQAPLLEAVGSWEGTQGLLVSLQKAAEAAAAALELSLPDAGTLAAAALPVPLLEAVQAAVQQSSGSVSAVAGAAAFLAGYGITAAAESVQSPGSSAGSLRPLPTTWEPDEVAEYFAQKPMLVASRALRLASVSAGFALNLLADNRNGEWESNQPQRAVQLRETLTKLGPTFIKVGQALSIRVDLFPAAYLKELRALQDRVPAFPSDQAQSIIDTELGAGAFAELSSTPIAAASLGQVYKGKLQDGREVAVKVQRPETLEGILLDLHLLRLVAPVIKKSQNLNSDLVGLVDEWGSGFVDELDYLKEARNGQQFLDAMRERELEAVTTAAVVPELTTRYVLTTEWIEGKRLDESAESDVARLCGVAINAYLTMLLDTGVLHADPHPGNLLRTSDGKLCILDWGLVTQVEPEKQYALVSYIANLLSEDYDEIARNYVTLGFVPPGKEKAIQDAGVVNILAVVLKQLAGGGGAKKIDVNELSSEISKLSDTYGNLFQIPSYFAYILRSFAILEGIGLSNDPDYAIVQECYPYLATKLFTDNDPRTRDALRRMIYTRDGDLNVQRAQDLSAAFASYGKSLAAPTQAQLEVEKELDRKFASFVFSQEGSYLQDVTINQTVRALDALGREAISQVRTSPFGQLAEALLPRELIKAVIPLTSKSSDDERTLHTLRELSELVQQTSGGLPLQLDTASTQRLVERLSDVAPIIAEGFPMTTQRFAAAALHRAADRLDEAFGRNDARPLPAAVRRAADLVAEASGRT